MDRFDPSVLQPQVDLFSERAAEGLDEGIEQTARRRTIESLFRPTDPNLYGSQTARALTGEQARSRRQQQAVGEFERSLTQADIQAKQRGEEGLAQAQTQQRQIAGQRQAAIEEADLQYETELQRRKQQLGSAVGQIAGTLAGTALGPFGAAAVGAGAGGLFGGGGGAVSGGVAGATTAMQFDLMGEEDEPDYEEMLAETARGGVPTGEGAQSLGFDFEGIGEELPQQDMSGFAMPQQQQQAGTQGERNIQNILQGFRPEAQKPEDQIFPENIDTTLTTAGGATTRDPSQMSLSEIQQEIAAIKSRGRDIGLDEFQRLETLQGLAQPTAMRELMGRTQPEGFSGAGDRFGRLFENIGANIESLGEFLYPRTTERYQRYINQ